MEHQNEEIRVIELQKLLIGCRNSNQYEDPLILRLFQQIDFSLLINSFTNTDSAKLLENFKDHHDVTSLKYRIRDEIIKLGISPFFELILKPFESPTMYFISFKLWNMIVIMTSNQEGVEGQDSQLLFWIEKFFASLLFCLKSPETMSIQFLCNSFESFNHLIVHFATMDQGEGSLLNQVSQLFLSPLDSSSSEETGLQTIIFRLYSLSSTYSSCNFSIVGPPALQLCSTILDKTGNPVFTSGFLLDSLECYPSNGLLSNSINATKILIYLYNHFDIQERKHFGLNSDSIETDNVRSDFFSNVLQILNKLLYVIFPSNSSLSSSTGVPNRSMDIPDFRSPQFSSTNPFDSCFYEIGDNLKRSLVLYGFRVINGILKLKIVSGSLITQLLEFCDSLHTVGTFIQNPLPMFFNLFGGQDDHLCEALYSLQEILVHLNPSFDSPSQLLASTPSSSDTLSASIINQRPFIRYLYDIVNPGTLFWHFLNFISNDVSLILDFLTSSETEYFLRYLLVFTKLLITKWDNIFWILTSLNITKQNSKSANSMSNSTSDIQTVEGILDKLILKNGTDLNNNNMSMESQHDQNLQPFKMMKFDFEQMDHDDGISEESSDQSGTNDEEEEYDDEMEELKIQLESVMVRFSKSESPFDQVLTFLIRLKISIEKAVSKNLIPYNIKPLLSKLSHLEQKYEENAA